jgi:membrane protein DedA with SNARE-associated domain
MSAILAFLPSFISDHLYLSVFFFLLVFGFTLPIPEEIALALVGVMVRSTKGGFWDAVLVGIPALLIADSLYYILARLIGPRLLRMKLLGRIIKPEKVRGGELYFQRRGPRIVFLSRFVVGLRAPIIVSAGLLRMRWTQFIVYDGLAMLIAIPAWLSVGFSLGAQLDSKVGILGKVLAIIGPIAIVLGSILLYRSVKSDKVKAAEETRGENTLHG